MRQLQMRGHARAEIESVSELLPGPGEVVIQTAVSALCGSELHPYKGDGHEGNDGHEAVGTVVKLGGNVTTLRKGQRVGVSAVAGCGGCEYCARGQYTWCANFRIYANMHAERFIAAANACHILPEDIPWDAGVLLTGDGMGVPYHTFTKIASPDIRTVAVFGVGPIGLGNVLVQAHSGRRVIAVDISDDRLRLASKLGAAETVSARDGNAVEQIKELTDGKGADACIEAAGRPETALACFDSVRTAGSVVFNGEQGEVTLSPSKHFIRRDIAAIGAWFYHYCEFAGMAKLYRNGLRVTDLITDRFAFDDASEAFGKFAAGSTGKVILEYQDLRTGHR